FFFPYPKIERFVESRDTLNSIALKFDTTPNELVQLNKLFSHAVVPGKVLYVHDPEYISSADSSPSLSPISPLSPTSSEADLEKATTVSHGPSRPARVVSSTSEEEEALTEKFLKMNCKYITDGKGIVSGVLLVTPNNIMFDPHKSDRLVQERGCEEYGIMCPLEEVHSAAMCREITDIRPSVTETGNDSASTAPRSTEASLSEDVFTESELSPVRDDALATSSDELQQIKSSGASSESVQTINTATEEPSMVDTKDVKEAVQDAETEGRGWRDSGIEQTHEIQKSMEAQTMQTTNDMKEGEPGMTNEFTPVQTLRCLFPVLVVPGPKGKQKSKLHKFLCLRVGRAMRKTFLSHASASMQQYAQRDRKHEYWFAVPSERSVLFLVWLNSTLNVCFLYCSFLLSLMLDKIIYYMQVSVTEYYRRIDALNSEDLRSLCKRLQITTKEEVNSKHMVKSDPEPESFRPSLNEPSVLLQPDQIEKLAKHLPPRTIGYPWSLAFSTSKHGMSIKSLYRAMQGQDSPVLMVIKDRDMDSLSFGGGGGEFGLWLDGDLYHGRTHSCKTFGNQMLSKTEDFYVQDIEIWAFE
uniref:Oxidation resistance protein 1 n=1 Tax=Sinocyclocheilus grahami TaxID=75366 RepID=A0A672KMS6_SINGR